MKLAAECIAVALCIALAAWGLYDALQPEPAEVDDVGALYRALQEAGIAFDAGEPYTRPGN